MEHEVCCLYFDLSFILHWVIASLFSSLTIKDQDGSAFLSLSKAGLVG